MKIALIGYGKMGVAIEEMAIQKGHSIAFKIDKSNCTQIKELNKDNTDIAIEFSDPSSAVQNIIYCLQSGIPVVSGTTGWLHNWSKVEEACMENHGSFFYASNYSIGVNIFFKLNERLAKLMEDQDYTVSMEEIHHTEKKDSPSGTAITLAEPILKLRNLEGWVNEKTDNPNTLGIVSKREPDVPGTHTIMYQSEIDEIQITHTAHGRKGFAKGALYVAEWIVQTKAIGMLSMQDFLKL